MKNIAKLENLKNQISPDKKSGKLMKSASNSLLKSTDDVISQKDNFFRKSISKLGKDQQD
jgi:hypothetical protein